LFDTIHEVYVKDDPDDIGDIAIDIEEPSRYVSTRFLNMSNTAKSLAITNTAREKSILISEKIKELADGVGKATELTHKNKDVANNLTKVATSLQNATVELKQEIDVFKI